jgi:uncharacterized protein YjlB
MKAETFHFEDDGGIPNSRLPALVYHGVPEARRTIDCEQLFAANDWRGAWRNGIYPFHHFHSTSHEVLGIVSGRAIVMLGGPEGREFEIQRGDVLVLPAGTGHCNLRASDDLLVIGAYPDGMSWDLRRGDPAEHDVAVANIEAVPMPRADPVEGTDGSLIEAWTAT